MRDKRSNFYTQWHITDTDRDTRPPTDPETDDRRVIGPGLGTGEYTYPGELLGFDSVVHIGQHGRIG